MLTLALPTGRSQQECLDLLKRCRIVPKDIRAEQRELEIVTEGMRIILVKPQDVPTMVHMGFAQLGLAGYDVILESCARVVDVLDTGLSRCDMVLAGPPCARELLITPHPPFQLKVATKYVNTAEKVLPERGMKALTVPMHGSVEIAPALGIADIIMDIVQTGSTLRANGLVVLEHLFPVSIHLIGHPGALETRWDEISRIAKAIREGGKSP
ncbi:ATP phosphoribosyltransferase [Thermanaerovibrio velox DSM 12556]|uniref:ATP phosphoribosyltransferase n=1 Tax=Thermanaerovibrio velox DSM 12556 TaxID=926567 RepID=H0UPX9_9BACT|nr:ATP phosphoribosyltransferase [Thermanaerovibrio velox]EHM10688.1 ATP phosphoribosyltransferase [Thermanaerovibrio velox DSM 12556]